jgi:hypothetical protein
LDWEWGWRWGGQNLAERGFSRGLPVYVHVKGWA